MTAQKFIKGFTLVELLIVISLLGAIATMVIATINPIEQANRTRDTRFKTDGGQLISAIDRHFAVVSEFPWVTSGDVTSNETSFGFVSAASKGVGICGADCTIDGTLITTDELKPEFRNRDFIKTAVADKKIYIGKVTGSSQSVYACYIPAAKTTRKKAVADQVVYTLDFAGSGARTKTNACDADTANWLTSGCYVCIPE